ncbi:MULTISPECIES: hypothetical protein [unclassified Rhodococcus (in: high G+C Gram-positive bacteria)]|uniref:hypothetical protein n=1 Tax=unclassified Rhodococcus (in: high G+C Gram-positive bacteria) TaxID=192944 RepID=UPI00096AB21C|nr:MULTISPECIES: hypothetical protein [unclassified Rhodococcus (in: high G+C Gram-positive bacteria)]
MAKDGWEFWRVNRVSSGELEWLAITRPGARAAIDRQKVWTLLPKSRAFVANWYLTEDYGREDDQYEWTYENIDSTDARAVALDVPEPSVAAVSRLMHPESCLTLNQIDRYPVDKLLGKRVYEKLEARR